MSDDELPWTAQPCQVELADGVGWAQVAVGQDATCGLQYNGSLWCWWVAVRSSLAAFLLWLLPVRVGCLAALACGERFTVHFSLCAGAR